MTKKEILRFHTSSEMMEEAKEIIKVESGWLIPSKCKGEPAAVKDLGIQFSMYHKESLEAHVLYVIGSIRKNVSDKELLEKYSEIALCHDIAKKLCLGVNKRNEICFYGHEAKSAEICKKLNLDLEDWQLAVIENHLKLKLLDENEKEIFKNSFSSEYGMKAWDALCILDSADIGFDFRNLDKVHQDEIKSKIMLGLEYVFDSIENIDDKYVEYIMRKIAL